MNITIFAKGIIFIHSPHHATIKTMLAGIIT